jgi:NAD(P)-dependent dehydrogenase (short-subunit alcohol dehydrogenase family)
MTKTWLVTGGSRGLGWEVARAALDTGDRVVATARNPERLAGLAGEYGDRVRVVALDVTDAAAARAAKASRTRAAEADEWADVSRSTDFAI